MTDEIVQAATPETQGTVAPSIESNKTQVPDAKTDAQADAKEGAGDDTERKTQEKQSRYDRKIGRLTAEKHHLRSEVSTLRERVAELEKRSVPQASEKPKPENYQTNDEYIEAVVVWELDQREAKKQKDEAAKETKQTKNLDVEKMRASFEEKEAAFIVTTPDYHDVIDDFADSIPRDADTAAITREILKHDKAPQILYALAKNDELKLEVYSVKPAFAAIKLNKIAETLGGSKDQKKATLPDPIKSKKTGGQATGKDPNKMSEAEYMEWRAAEIRKKRK